MMTLTNMSPVTRDMFEVVTTLKVAGLVNESGMLTDYERVALRRRLHSFLPRFILGGRLGSKDLDI